MDFSTIPPDAISGVIGVGFGALTALRIDRWRERDGAKQADRRLLQNLIDRLAAKRAFGHPDDVGDVDDPGDKQRCRDSVLDARERVATARDSLQVELGAVDALRAMEKACMDYLNFDERDEVAYARGLLALKGQLLGYERELASKVGGLTVTAPGQRDSSAPAWLPTPRNRTN